MSPLRRTSPTGGASGRRRSLRATRRRHTRLLSRRRSVTKTSWQRRPRTGLTSRHPRPTSSTSPTPASGSAPSSGTTTWAHSRHHDSTPYRIGDYMLDPDPGAAGIGIALNDRRALDDLDLLEPTDYRGELLGDVWALIRSQHQAGNPHDVTTTAARARIDGLSADD